MISQYSEPVPEREASLMNVLQLAYIGDAVWELIVRSLLVRRGLNVRHMHSECIRKVNAHAQAESLRLIAPELSSVESDLVKRGRNTHTRHPVPKNQSPEDYALATAFEVLIGFLYLTGNHDRILFLSGIILGGNSNG